MDNIGDDTLKKAITIGIVLIILTGVALLITSDTKGTELSGNESGIWDANGSPYYVTGDVIVPAGQKLEIDASGGPVYVIFNGTYSISVDGSLYVNGTAGNKVYFMSNQSTQSPDQWDAIYVRDANGHLEMRNAVISGATSGVVLESDGNIVTQTEVYNCTSGIVMDSGNHNRISDSHTHDNYNYGMWLTASSQNNTIENSNSSSNRVGGVMVDTGSDYTTILNTTASYNIGGGVQTGIYVQDSNFATIKNCNVSYNGAGIGLRNSAWDLVENCTAVDNDYLPQRSISLDTASNITIRDCFMLSITAPPAETAIYLASSVDNRIENNTMYKCHFGVQMISYDDRNTIANNTMVSGNYGIKADYYSDNNTLRDNIIENSRYQGIIIEQSMDNWVINNTISETMSGTTSAGIMITYYSARNRVVHNNIRDNEGMGVYIPGDGSTDPNNNTVYNNNFFNNSIHAYDNTGKNYWNTTYSQSPLMGGNYWDNYTGTDEFSGPNQDIPGCDLIGDTPYLWISGGSGANDSYPLMEPIGGVPPESKIDEISQYWHNSDITITATASDTGSGVANVTLFYRSSYDGSAWGIWTSYGVNNTGSWSWDFTFPDGDAYYEFYSLAKDKAGNIEEVPTAADASCAYDSSTPISILEDISEYWSTSPQLTINATAQESGSGVSSVSLIYRHSADNSTWSNWTLFYRDEEKPWSWNFDFPNGDGYYQFRSEAEDTAGNREVKSSAEQICALDREKPSIDIYEPEANTIFPNSSISVNWTGSDETTGIDHYEIRIDSGTWTNVGTATTHDFTRLSDGSHSVDVKAVDRAGNENTDAVSFTVDVTAPTVSITAPADGSIFNTNTVTVSWTGSDATTGIDHYEVRIDSGTWTDVGTATTHEFTGLSDGFHTVHVRAVDGGGNENITSSSILTDKTAPALQIISPSLNENINAINISISWRGSDDASGIDHYEIQLDTRANTIVGTNVSYKYSGLSSGNHTVLVRAIDRAGNTAEARINFTTSDRGTIKGTVIDINGFPLSGAEIILDTGEKTLTDENGEFNISASRGRHNLTISISGYETTTESVYVETNESTAIQIELSPVQTQQKSSNLWLYLILGVVLLIGAALLLSKKKKRGEKDTLTDETEEIESEEDTKDEEQSEKTTEGENSD